METALERDVKAVIILGVAASLIVASAYAVDRYVLADAQSAARDVIGTAGRVEPPPVADSAVVTLDAVAPAIIQEVETITGSVDGHQLIGRKVDLHVPVQSVADNAAFWIGERDNRVLVRLRHAPHGAITMRTGQRAAVSGTIQRAPSPDEIDSWGLTVEEAADLADRRIYIRADGISSHGHGH
jgi:hypothetical protein